MAEGQAMAVTMDALSRHRFESVAGQGQKRQLPIHPLASPREAAEHLPVGVHLGILVVTCPCSCPYIILVVHHPETVVRISSTVLRLALDVPNSRGRTIQ